MIASERLLFLPLLLVFVACGGVEEGTTLAPPADAGVTTVPDAGTTADAGVEPPRDGGPPPPRDGGVPTDIRDRLAAIDGLDVEEITPRLPNTRAFVLRLRQPEDHQNLDGAWFEQRLVLVHRDENAPMVISTTGYGLFGVPEQFAAWLSEPAAALEANQLTVEHRFFGESIAPTPQWRHLNIEQSANDSHRIVALLSSIYSSAWVGTGVSKGGMTAIFHHRFFPDDLAAIVPYVAPISFGQNDPRYLEFLARVGPADGVCRERVLDMEVEVFERRDELARHYTATDPTAAPYSTEVLAVAATLPAWGFHWGFWQQGGTPEACAAVPPRDAPIATLAGWFPFRPEYLAGGDFDPDLSPYGYQVSNELGSQAIDYSHLGFVSRDVDYSLLPQVMQPPPPWGAAPAFDPQAMRDVDTFLRERAEHVLGVYGAWDPWTAGIITVDEANDSTVIVVPEVGHGAQIAMLPRARQDEALARLHAWVGIRSFATPDWTRARARIDAHRADHATLVRLTERYDRLVRR